ncbi:MAG: membrane integrity-associated transporter subunit PqiC [Alphaproteobacteria bacterium]
MLFGALVACSSPAPVLYTITPVPGAVHSGSPKIIVLRQIGLARYLDRPEIVASTENNRMEVMSNDWWGEPLGPMLSRVLTEELGQRLPQSTVLSETGAVSAPPDATIELNMRRLDKDAAGNLILQAQAGVTFKGRSAPVLRNFNFIKAPPTTGISGQVAAASTAIGELADGLALMVLARP